MSKKSILILVILLGLVAGAGYVLLLFQFEQKTDEAVHQERTAWQQKAGALEQKAGSLEKEVKKLAGDLQVAEQGPRPDAERQREAFGEPPAETTAAPVPADVGASVQAFFAYIDRKGYLRSRGIELPARDFFRSVMERLQATTPVVSAESQDAYALVKNISFFFRTLGKTDVLLIRDVLQAESDIMEQTAGLFYQWLDPGQAIQDPARITMPFETMYEYAAFFLQTIAGRSYLFRRDAPLRLLVQYYSLCIVDRAEDQMLNKYGIDIVPHTDMLAAEIGSSRQLAGRRAYLNTLELIRKKRAGIRMEQPVGE